MLAVAICIAGGLAALLWNRHRDESLRAWLRNEVQALGPSAVVRVEGNLPSNGKSVLVMLGAGDFVPPHHSSPMEYRRLVATGNGRSLSLVLARDSLVASEYWIYLPSAPGASVPGRLIGRLAGLDLDDVWGRR